MDLNLYMYMGIMQPKRELGMLGTCMAVGEVMFPRFPNVGTEGTLNGEVANMGPHSQVMILRLPEVMYKG